VHHTERKMLIKELIKSASVQIQADFDLSRKKYGSPNDIGADRVNILQDFLVKYLPRYYGFGNGEIVDTHDNRSGQVDIIICNQYHPFTYNKEGLGLFLVEGIDWAIEVKSNLSSELEQGLLQVQKIKRLKKHPQTGDMAFSSSSAIHRNQVPCLLFGYQSPSIGPLRDNVKRLVVKLGLTEEELPDAVVALNKGIVFNTYEGDSIYVVIDGIKRYGKIGVELKDDTLFYTLVFLSEHTPHTLYQNPIILRYATFPSKTIVHHDKSYSAQAEDNNSA